MAKVERVATFGKLYRKRNLLIMLCLLFLVLSIALALLTYYGQNAGGFSIKLAEDADEMGLQLSTDPNFNTYSARLIADSVSDAQPIAYTQLIQDNVVSEVKSHSGTYIPQTNRKGFVGYTFYVKNTGSEDVYLTSTMSIVSSKNDVDKAMWVWACFGDDDDGQVYQAMDEQQSSSFSYPSDYPSRTYFSGNNVFTKTEMRLSVNRTMKISIIVWLEGNDPDCTDSIKGGTCRYAMKLSIHNIIV